MDVAPGKNAKNIKRTLQMYKAILWWVYSLKDKKTMDK